MQTVGLQDSEPSLASSDAETSCHGDDIKHLPKVLKFASKTSSKLQDWTAKFDESKSKILGLTDPVPHMFSLGQFCRPR